MIYTFYSYKGGVGRSMALANIAELFYQAGLSVLMIDWDLEAPGLERFFAIDNERALDQAGVIDLLLAYKQHMARVPSEADDDEQQLFENVESYLLDIYPRQVDNHARLALLTAGRRSSEHFAAYAKAVLTFDWQDFYEHWDGELYIELVRRECQQAFDVILIDSRTGVTEMGGICTYQLADVIVMLCAANQQNLDGVHKMARDFRRPEVVAARAGRELELIAVPARLEQAEGNRLNQFKNDFLARVDTFAPAPLRTYPEYLWSLGIPYVPYYAFSEDVAVRERGVAIAATLVQAFERLTRALARLAAPSSALKAAFESDYAFDTTLSASYSDYAYDVFISYSTADADWVWATLMPRLKSAGLQVCVDRESFDIGVPMQVNIENAVNSSRRILLILSPDWLQEQWPLFDELLSLENADSTLLRIIPAIRQPCELPSRIAPLTASNLTDQTNPDQELPRLLDALRDARRLGSSSIRKEEIDQQTQLLAAHRATLSVLLKQEALMGAAYVPPAVVVGIREARDRIRTIKHMLRTWSVAVANHMDDEEAVISPVPIGTNQRERVYSPNTLRVDISSMLERPEVRLTLTTFLSELQSVCEHITLLSNYSKLHDELRQLDNQSNTMVSAARRLPDSNAWDEIEQCEPDFQITIGKIRDTVANIPLHDASLWMAQLQRLQQDLRASVDASAEQTLPPIIGRLRDLVDYQISRINSRIIGVADTLRIALPIQALRLMSDQLASLDLDSDGVQWLEGLRANISIIEQTAADLADTIELYRSYQILDDELRRLDRGPDQSLTDLVDMWPELVVITRTICEQDLTKWGKQTSVVLEELDAAVSDADHRLIRRQFLRYRRQMQAGLNQSGTTFWSLCQRLVEFFRPLDSLLVSATANESARHIEQ